MIPRRIAVAIMTVLILGASTDVLQAQRKRRPKLVRPMVVTIKGDSNVVASPAVDPDSVLRLESFYQVWNTINRSYFDPTFNGLDWAKVKAEFLPRVNAAKSDAEFNALLIEMVDRLNRSHFGIIPKSYFETVAAIQKRVKAAKHQTGEHPSDASDMDADAVDSDDADIADMDARYGVGIHVRMLNDKFVVVSVDPDSSAATAGVTPGFIIEKINGVSVSDLIQRIVLSDPNSREIRRYLPTVVENNLLSSMTPNSITVSFLDGSDQGKDILLQQTGLQGDMASFGSVFPKMFIQYASRSIDADTGYIRFSGFGLPVVGRFCDSIASFHDKKYLIIDLRGNTGGLLGTLYGLSGMLSGSRMDLGKTINRTVVDPMVAVARKNHFDGRIAVLVDSQSASASEIFAAALQESGRAIVVGDPTAGAALPASSQRLPTGALFMYPIANYKTSKDKLLEGNGVMPDIRVSLDRHNLLMGVDDQLARATAALRVEKADTPVDSVAASTLSVISGPTRALASGGSAAYSVDGPPPPAKVAPPAESKVLDPKALAAIQRFSDAVGGLRSLQAITSYVGTGKIRVLQGGSDERVPIKLVRETPDKFLMVYRSPVFGEIRSFYGDGKVNVQTEIGVDTSVPLANSKESSELFQPIFFTLSTEKMQSLRFVGDYETEGKMLTLLEYTLPNKSSGAIAFNKEDGMLVRVVYGGMSYALSDYRKTGSYTLPFHIAYEGLLDIYLDELSIDGKLDPATFVRKEMCFDKIK